VRPKAVLVAAATSIATGCSLPAAKPDPAPPTTAAVIATSSGTAPPAAAGSTRRSEWHPSPAQSPGTSPSSMPSGDVPSPVAQLPADLTTPPSTDATGHSHEPADDGAATSSNSGADVATAWTVERHTTRFDDPPDDRRNRLAALSSTPAIATAADRLAPRADNASGGATWAVVNDVDPIGDGWWRIQFTLKRTRRGQVGPSSTSAAIDVHINDAGLVDGERP
jgi:hypothetical protein